MKVIYLELKTRDTTQSSTIILIATNLESNQSSHNSTKKTILD